MQFRMSLVLNWVFLRPNIPDDRDFEQIYLVSSMRQKLNRRQTNPQQCWQRVLRANLLATS